MQMLIHRQLDGSDKRIQYSTSQPLTHRLTPWTGDAFVPYWECTVNTQPAHSSGRGQAATGLSYLLGVCLLRCVPRVVTSCMSGLLSHSPITPAEQKWLSSPSILPVESCQSSEGPTSSGAKVLINGLFLAGEFALTCFRCQAGSFFLLFCACQGGGFMKALH